MPSSSAWCLASAFAIASRRVRSRARARRTRKTVSASAAPQLAAATTIRAERASSRTRSAAATPARARATTATIPKRARYFSRDNTGRHPAYLPHRRATSGFAPPMVAGVIEVSRVANEAEERLSLEIYNAVWPQEAVTIDEVHSFKRAVVEYLDLVARVDGEPAGSAVVTIQPQRRDLAYLLSTVRVEHRGRGVGTRLYQEMSRWASA